MRIRGRRVGLLLASVLPLLADDDGTWIENSADIGMEGSQIPRVPQHHDAYSPEHVHFSSNDLTQEVMDNKPYDLIPSSNKAEHHKAVSDEDDDVVTSSTSSLTMLLESPPTITTPLSLEDSGASIGTVERENTRTSTEHGQHDDVNSKDVGGRKTNDETASNTRGKNPLFERLEEAVQNILSRTYDDRNNDDKPKQGSKNQGKSDSNHQQEENVLPLSSSIVPNSRRVMSQVQTDSGLTSSSENIGQPQEEKHQYQDHPIHASEGERILEDTIILEDKRQQDGTDGANQGDETVVNPSDDEGPDLLLEQHSNENIMNEVLSSNDNDLATAENVSFSLESEDDICINVTSAGDKNVTCNDSGGTENAPTNSVTIDTEAEIKEGEPPNNNLTAKEEELGIREDEVHNATVDTETVSLTVNDTASTKDEVEESEESEREVQTEELTEDEDDDLNARVSVDYASKSAGAQIIEKSSSFKGTSNLLNDDRDKYAIAPCQDKKFVVVSLSEDIRVEVIKLANYERFSSTVKDFQVMGSQTLGKWADLGTYTAASGHGEQTFPLKSTTWARYLKFKFLTHHGAEYYCTVSQIKVHGSTVVEGFHEQWKNDDDTALADKKVEEIPPAVGTIPGKNQTSEPTTDIVKESASAMIMEDIRTTESDPDMGKKSDQESTNKTIILDSTPQISPSVDSFKSHRELLDLLLGNRENEHLFEELYSLIPSVISSLPPLSRKSVRATTEERDERTMRRISQFAIKSFYSIRSTIAGTGDSTIGREDITGAIATPKMNDWNNEAVKHRFGGSLDLLNRNIGIPKLLDTTGLFAARTENTEKGTVQSKTPVQVPDGSNAAADVSQTEEVTAPDVPEDSIGVEVDSSIAEQSKKMDLALSNLLEGLPSAECLSTLDLATFKAKATASRKSSSSNGQSQGARMMETPIYQMLMDQIVALQISLSAHDQYTKASVDCYQRVLLDLAMQMNIARYDQEERLKRLEEQMMQSLFLRFSKFASDDLAAFGKRLVSNANGIYLDVIHKWIIGFKETCVRMPATMKPYVLQCRQRIRMMLHSMNIDSLLNRTISPWFFKFEDRIDQIATPIDVSLAYAGTGNEEDSLHDLPPHSSQGFFAPLSSYCEDGLWTVSVLSVMLVLVGCRLVMCCTGSTSPTSSSAGYVVKHLSKRNRKNEYSSFGGGSGNPSNGTHNESKSTASRASSNSSKSRRRRARAKGKDISSTAGNISMNSRVGDCSGIGDDIDDIPVLHDENGEVFAEQIDKATSSVS